MEKVYGKLTVYFEEPFWVGIFERIEDGKLSVAKVTFGAEPKDVLIIGIGYQLGKIYRKYCWDIISIMVAITSTAIVIYFGDWIKSIFPINLITLLLLVHVVYIGIRCYVKDWTEERGYF